MSACFEESDQERSPLQGFLPFFWLASTFISGILLADTLTLSLWIWAVLTAAPILLLFFAHSLPKKYTLTHLLLHLTGAERRLPSAILVATFFCGAWRHSATRPIITPQDTAYYNERGSVLLTGEVVQPPTPTDKQINIIVRSESLLLLEDLVSQVKPIEVSGLVLVQAPLNSTIAYGDLVQVRGELQLPFESADFSYREYLARKGIYSLIPYAQVDVLASGLGSPIRAFVYRLADRSYSILQEIFPSPEADLLAGILLGREHGLSPSIKETFRRTGTTHIIAISGFNIAILSGLFAAGATRLFGRRWGTLTAIIGIGLYSIMVGGDAAVVRAAIMGGLGVMGGMFGRRQNGLNSLGLAVLGMTLVDPDILWDIGFQLSAGATLGLVLYAQPLEERLINLASKHIPEEKAHLLVGPLSEWFLFTIIAQAMTYPITITHFGGFTWMALVANPLILPVQPLVMILGGLALLLGLLSPGLGSLAAAVALPFTSYTVRMVTWMGRLPGAELTSASLPVTILIALLAVVFIFTFLTRSQRKLWQKKIFSPTTGILVLAGFVIMLWNQVLTSPDGNLHITLLDSEGTVLIQSPWGDTILIGGGTSPSQLNQDLGQMLPVGDRELDVLIIASSRRDDLNALSGISEKYTLKNILWGISSDTNQTAKSLYHLWEDKEFNILPLETGQRINLGADASIKTLWQEDGGSVFWLEWEYFSAVIPVGKTGTNWLDIPSPPDIVLLPEDVTASELLVNTLNQWNPVAVLFPLPKNKQPLRGEHDLVTLLSGYPLITTLEYDWVRISSDGKTLWVTAE